MDRWPSSARDPSDVAASLDTSSCDVTGSIAIGQNVLDELNSYHDLTHGDDVWGELRYGDGFEPFGGDFYREADDVERGVTMGNGGADLNSFFAWDTYDKDRCAHTLEPPILARIGTKHSPHVEPSTDVSACLAELVLRTAVDAPQIPYGGVASTSVELHEASPKEALQVLLELIQTRATSSITKFRLPKCSITADLFSESDHFASHCSMKMRVFQRSPPTPRTEALPPLVVEFSRRTGDAVAFGHFFRTASVFLKVRFGASGGVCTDEIMVSAPPTTSGAEIPTSDDLKPLVDAVANATSPAIQAEALASLVVLAKEAASTATVVCAAIAHLQGLLAGLVASPLLRVAYLAARLSLSLAKHGCVDGVLAASLQRAALEVIVAETTNPLVRSELANVLLTTLKQPALHCSLFQPMQGMHELINEALWHPNCGDPSIQNCLYEALGVLNRREPLSAYSDLLRA